MLGWFEEEVLKKISRNVIVYIISVWSQEKPLSIQPSESKIYLSLQVLKSHTVFTHMCVDSNDTNVWVFLYVWTFFKYVYCRFFLKHILNK